MINLDDFHQDFVQSIISDADSRGLLRNQSFFEYVCQDLIEEGQLTPNYSMSEYKKVGVELGGYDYDDERQILSLIVAQHFQSDEISTLNNDHISTKFKRLQKFYEKAVKGLYREMEESFDSYDAAFHIFQLFKNDKISKLKLILITDGKLISNLKELPEDKLKGVSQEFSIVDINELYKIFLSNNSGSHFSVNDISLPALEIHTSSSDYRSYLSYLSGDQVVNIYENFGPRLFEQNVRTFLQFKGGVNKGLRNTIKGVPEMFFAYNNGITATASNVETDVSGNITSIDNFQIVNGGQTTSSIYAAYKTSKLDVSKVSVQMKLSVVTDAEQQNDFVSKVSEYANTQNKINKSDFFSNSPFHKEFKDYSKRLWAPTLPGSQRKTQWFYERVRGEYLNEQAYLTPAKKKQFQNEHPKNQVIDKTFLAKSENAWLRKPHIVSKGAQYSFKYFADVITSQLEKDSLSITENYFKDVISRALLFKETEKLVSKADWYDGGHRAATVAYTIAYLSCYIKSKGKHFDFSVIWDKQSIPDKIRSNIEKIAEAVYMSILNPPEGNANVSQWCKKELCWESIKRLNLSLDISDNYLSDKEGVMQKKRQDKKEKRLDNGIEIQMLIAGLSRKNRKELFTYFKENESTSYLSKMQIDILHKYAEGSMQLPSEKQSKIIYSLYQTAVKEGLIFPDKIS